MTIRMSTLFLVLLASIKLYAEEFPYNFRNEIYDEYIKSVTLELNNNPTGFPLLTLGSSQYLMLKFDDMLDEQRVFYYRIIHCDKNWEPSGLREIEYISGYNDERLRNYDYSVGTRTSYFHYWQQFPNNNTKFKVSGNYLLVIYEDKIDFPVLSRRFVVSENKVDVNIKSTFPGDVANIRYKQELLVDINFDKFKMRNPVDEISLVMLQNENWNSQITAKPSFFSGTVLKFNRLKTFAWWGLTEYREFDTRTIRRLGRHVQSIERNKSSIDVLLVPDEPNRNKVHLNIFDFNGRFFVDNIELLSGTYVTDALDQFSNNVGNDQSLTQSLRDSIVTSISRRNVLIDGIYRAEDRNIKSDYTNVTFSLRDNIDHDDHEIYVLGAMNNWLPSEEYRMKYDEARDLYTTNAMLKQGYYNYYYGLVDKKGNIDYAGMEGSWNETENEYQVIVYYRGLGDIYDRVISYRTYNTNANLLNIR